MLQDFLKGIDARYLRLAARIDSPRPDRFLPWAVALILFGIMTALSLARLRSLDAGVDLAIWLQSVELVSVGKAPRSSLLGGHILAEQLALVVYPIGWLSRWLPARTLLLTLQAGALAAGAVPIWRLARDVYRLRVSASLTMMASYALFPPLHNVNLGDFHPETLALPLLLWGAWAGLQGREKTFAVLMLVVVLCRLDLALAVAGLGFVMWTRGHVRTGIGAMGGGVLYALVAVLVIQPALSVDGYVHAEAFADYGDQPLDILWNMLSSPGRVLSDLFAEENFEQLVLLFAPVLFLPVLTPRVILAVLPLQALYLVANVVDSAETSQQLVAATAFVYIASMGGLRRLGREGVERVHINPRIMGAFLLAAAVFFVRDAASSPYRTPWEWGGRDRADQDRLAAVQFIEDSFPPSVGVRAGEFMLVGLAERPSLERFDPVQWPLVGETESDIEVLAIDRFDAGWTSEDLDFVEFVLGNQGFSSVFVGGAGGVEVYAR